MMQGGSKCLPRLLPGMCPQVMLAEICVINGPVV